MALEAEFFEAFTKSALSQKYISKTHMKHEISRAPKYVTVLEKRLRKGFRKGFASKSPETFHKNAT